MDRRRFLTRGATLTAGMWAAPQMRSVARAQIQQSPFVCCTADSYGLSVSLLGGTPTVFGTDSCTDAEVGAGTVRVTATAACGAPADTTEPCAAGASVARLSIRIGRGPTATRITATLLASGARADCEPCQLSGDTSVATLRFNGDPIPVGGCNFVVPIPVLGGEIVVNEQACHGNTVVANALRVTVPGTLEVVAAHSAPAGEGGCACRTCG